MRSFSNEFLAQARLQQDPLADKAIQAMFESETPYPFRNVLTQLQYNGQPLTTELPKELHVFFTATNSLPKWAEPSKMEKASQFFQQNVVQIMSLLGTYALPYCYAAADGAQVLYLSERIRHDTHNRLLETALFIFDLFSKGALTPEGRALRSIQKVRLIHATIRYHIQQKGYWNPSWGAPINQEDMAGTNLAFSLIIIRGLKKIGCSVSAQETEAWLHAWRVFGVLMGVEEALLPQHAKQAFQLEKAIRLRNFKPSEEGKALTHALLRHYAQLPEVARFPKGYMPSYMRFVLGDTLSDLLDIPPADWSGIFVQQFRLLNLLGISPNQVPLTRERIVEQLTYEPTFTPPASLGISA